MWTYSSTYKYSIHFFEFQQVNDNLHAIMFELFNFHIAKNSLFTDACDDLFLTDIAQYTNGLAMQKYRPQEGEVGIAVLKIKELGQKACDNASDLCSPNIKTDYIVNDGDIIFSWSGTLLVDIWTGGKCGLNQHLFKVITKKYPSWFVYFWTCFHLDNFIRIAKDKAVTMGHIKRSDLERSKVFAPSDSALIKLDEIFTPIYNSYISKRIENRKLSHLRDTLLPKLMSGELKISDLNS